jgi:hypothetical protein
VNDMVCFLGDTHPNLETAALGYGESKVLE